MYTSFFGLREKPFDLLPNPDFLFPSRAHKRALTYLTHGIRERVGFILLTGEVGSGKTTLIRNLIRSQLRDSVLAKVFNTRVDSLQLFAQINADFGLQAEGKDKATLLRDLNDFLIEQYAQRRQSVLIIDEAQNLSADILEEVRMLSNLETDRDKLLQIILVGQPQLRDILADPALLQLRQRIQINCHLHPLTSSEIRDYIAFRLTKAGNREALQLSDDAVEAIATYTRGIPRLVNILCDFIMIDAYSAQTNAVDGKAVHELAGDLSFEAQYWESKNVHTGPEARGGIATNVDAVTLAVSSQAKILSVIGSLNKRLEVLEGMPAWDRASLLDLRERLDSLEAQNTALGQELWTAMRQLRTDVSLRLQPHPASPGNDGDGKGGRPGAARSLWRFLWGG